MAKPIQERIFKSRLTITYRTNITGTEKQEKLPFRILTLGNFMGDLLRDANCVEDIDKRPVQSIKRGMTVDNFLSELTPMVKLPDHQARLRSYIPGKIVISAKGRISKEDLAGNKPVSILLREGSGVFLSTKVDNGTGDIGGTIFAEGKLEVNVEDGQIKPQKIKLNVSGILKGFSDDHRPGKPPEIMTGYLINKLEIDGSMVEVTPDEELAGVGSGRALKIAIKEYPIKAERTIAFQRLSDFSPDAVGGAIPELRRLLVIKGLLLELQAALRNRPELRKAFKQILPNMEDTKEQSQSKLESLQMLKDWIVEKYPLLVVKKDASPEVSTDATEEADVTTETDATTETEEPTETPDESVEK